MLKNEKIIIKRLLSTDEENFVCGFLIEPFLSPNYKSLSNNCPDLCISCESNNNLGKVCREFYKNINEKTEEQICPYGVKIYIKYFSLSSKRVFFLSQINFSQSVNNGNFGKSFPRTSKKEAKKHIRELTRIIHKKRQYIN